MALTNLQHLMNALKRAQNETMVIFNNGQEGNNGYVVINEDKAYNVSIENGEITGCTCPHNEHRGVICKHMVRVSLSRDINIAGLRSNLVSPPVAKISEAI